MSTPRKKLEEAIERYAKFIEEIKKKTEETKTRKT